MASSSSYRRLSLLYRNLSVSCCPMKLLCFWCLIQKIIAKTKFIRHFPFVFLRQRQFQIWGFSLSGWFFSRVAGKPVSFFDIQIPTVLSLFRKTTLLSTCFLSYFVRRNWPYIHGVISGLSHWLTHWSEQNRLFLFLPQKITRILIGIMLNLVTLHWLCWLLKRKPALNSGSFGATLTF